MFRFQVILIYFILLSVTPILAQHHYFHEHTFTKADTLRGQLRPERTCYDVKYYELDLEVDIENQSINGSVDICFEAMTDFKVMQIDLFDNLDIDSILLDNRILSFERIHNAVFIQTDIIKQENLKCVKVFYNGIPIKAKNAPWDGGFSWKRDQKGNPWLGVSCEGIGASLWWPNKDHLSDEPDSVSIKVTVPDPFVCISNGNLRKTVPLEDDRTQYNWFVSYPINNYNVTLNIGMYEHFQDVYTAADGSKLDLDYYVMPYNLKKAKKQFAQVPKMLACYEHYFGKYPFWNDGYALVETPYLGMEHQGAIAYGNQYMRGYLGRMIPDGMDWDYIIIHETGHEYWGNSISCNDHAEMWIHEAFTTYMEALYVECRYSYEEAIGYLKMQKPFIANQQPVIGVMDVNFGDWSSSDHYYKGSWILHTLRHAIHDDKLFFDILKSFYQKHQLSNIHSEDFFNYVNEKTGQNWNPFFEQYLKHPNIPKLVYRLKQIGKDVQISCIWETNVQNFNMPILVGNPENFQLVQPENIKKEFLVKNCTVADFQVATDLFYVTTKLVD